MTPDVREHAADDMQNLPRSLTTWFAEHEARLNQAGTTAELQRSPDNGRPESSAWLIIESDDRVAQITVWDSGETELDFGTAACSEVRTEQRRLQNDDDLHDALRSVLEWITPLTAASLSASDAIS